MTGKIMLLDKNEAGGDRNTTNQ